MNKKIRSIIDFVKQAEKLKTELRHSWTSRPHRQESVAEHTWSTCLLVLTLFDELSMKVDQLRTLKMILVHDLAEVLIGDIPAFEISDRQAAKFENEKKAMREMVSGLSNQKLATEVVGLWEEFEAGQTPEAKLAKTCDKLDVLLQHLHTDIGTWDEGDFKLNPYYDEGRFNFDDFIRKFKDQVNWETMQALEEADLLDKVSSEHQQLWVRQKRLRLDF